jgi:RNA polymerase sigma-19 factor, ECF subfamily
MNFFSRNLIIERLNRGEPGAVGELAKARWAWLLAYVQQKINSREDAQDIVVECFQKLLEKHPRFEHMTAVKNYLKKIADNRITDIRRHREMAARNGGKVEAQFLKEHEELGIAEKAELLDRVHNEIEKLPENFRATCRLFFIYEQGYEEIASRLGISRKTVMNHVTFGRKKLKSMLGDDYHFGAAAGILFMLSKIF